MTETAKIFTNGRSQAVRLPRAFRFDTPEVFVRRDPATGDVILSRKPADWSGLLAAIHDGGVPADFLEPAERNQGTANRDPFEDWRE